MLVPLNILAFAALSPHGAEGLDWTFAVELLAVSLFGWLTFLAGRVVMPSAPLIYAGGVIAISSSSLVMPFLSFISGTTLVGTALWPVGFYVMAMAERR